MSKVLVTGAGGQVGRCLKAALPMHRLEGAFLTHQDLDITVRDDVYACAASIRPDVIINAAAYTAVDQAESDKQKAMKVNAEGPANLARAAAHTEAVLIHISTDYVFDGSKADAWQECDSMNPLSVYGASKAAGEDAVRESLERHLVFRTAWVFSTYGTNFVKTMLRRGPTQDEVSVVSDQSGSPTGAEDIAQPWLAWRKERFQRKSLNSGARIISPAAGRPPGTVSRSWFSLRQRLGGAGDRR